MKNLPTFQLSNLPTLIVITGQTASGKTQLAYDLAKKYNGEIINYDSRQVYKHLDIITGKTIFPDIKTHLLDIVDPKVQFSSFDYVSLAIQSINRLIDNNITPVLVGGTYLYLKHLLYGIDTQVPADWNLRGELNKKSVLELQKILQKENLQVFEKLNQSDRNNPHRIVRKIELSFRHPGANVVSDRILKVDSITSFQNDKVIHRHSQLTPLSFPRKRESGLRQILNQVEDDNNTPQFFKLSNLKIKIIGLRFKNKKKLKKAVEKRVEQRIKDGAFQEVKHLIKNGYKLTDPGLKTIGYKQIFDYYSGKVSKEKTIEQWISKELQYAKRQYTFMKKDKNIKWQDV